MARKISLPTMQQIEAIAASGDVEQLRAINERLAKTANQRMRQLEKSGYEGTAAYKIAKDFIWQEADYTHGGVFSRSKDLKEDQLVEQIEKEVTFLRSKTSTVSGEKARRQKIFESLTTEHTIQQEGQSYTVPAVINLDELGIQVPSEYKGEKNDYFRDKFFDFLDENVWKDVKKFLYVAPEDYTKSTRTKLVDQASEAIARGADVNELKELYKQYLRNEISIFDVWDKWTSVKTTQTT